jgi:hypothetical protein
MLVLRYPRHRETFAIFAGGFSYYGRIASVFWYNIINTFRINNQGVAFQETENSVCVAYALYSLLLRDL